MLLRGEVTIPVTIHDKISTLWQKRGGGGQLREGVRDRYGTGCYRFYTRMPEQAGTSEFEI